MEMQIQTLMAEREVSTMRQCEVISRALCILAIGFSLASTGTGISFQVENMYSTAEDVWLFFGEWKWD